MIRTKRVGKAARDAGFKLGYYHFFRDNVSAEKQFANLIAHIDTRLTTLPIVLDYEKMGLSVKSRKRWRNNASGRFLYSLKNIKDANPLFLLQPDRSG